MLTHWGRDKMAAFSQTTFSHAFSWMKKYEFKSTFHWSLFLSINNIPVLVQIMAWRRLCDKPFSEPMMFSWLTHICVTRPQWVNQCVTLTTILWWYGYLCNMSIWQVILFINTVLRYLASHWFYRAIPIFSKMQNMSKQCFRWLHLFNVRIFIYFWVYVNNVLSVSSCLLVIPFEPFHILRHLFLTKCIYII